MFGTLTNGAITVSNGNLALTGNQMLDQDVNVNGGAGTMSTTGVLRMSARHLVTGAVSLSSGTFDVLAAGAATGQYGGLSVTGAVTLAGGLALDLTGGYALSKGDTFDLIDDYSSISGNFVGLAVNGASCAGLAANQWRCAVGGGAVATIAAVTVASQLDLVVQDVPEPASFGMFAAALAGLAWMTPRLSPRRQRRS